MRRRSSRVVVFALCVAAILAALTPLGAAVLLAVLPVLLALGPVDVSGRFAPVPVLIPRTARHAHPFVPRGPPRS
jgi:hypothetical protein